MNPILVTTYVNPDLDGIACSFAYSELLNAKGTEAIAGYFGEPSPEARYVLDRFQIPYPELLNDIGEFEKIILVDASVVNDLDRKIPLEKVIEVVDHRKINDSEKFPDAKIQIDLVGSAATLIAEKFQNAGIIPTKSATTLMVSAIISNTFNFQAAVATDRDRAVYEWLFPISGLSNQYARELFLAKSDLSGDKLQCVLRDDLGVFDFGRYHAGIAQIEMIGGFELLQNRKQEILHILNEIKVSENLDWIYLSIVELEKACNIFIVPDEIAHKALSDLLSITFDGDTALRQGLVMRKQAAAMLKEYFTKK